MPEVISELLDPAEPLPFEELFVPLVRDARARLAESITAVQNALLRAEAHAGWDKYLLKRLSGTGSKAAHCQFQAFRSVRSVFSKAAVGEHRRPDSLYREFVDVSPKQRLQKLFEEFPTLAPQCEILISNWIATVTEFLNRLEADRGQLDDCFVGEMFTCPVVRLQAGLSDPHRGGRCVVRLTFASGSRLIYKPRSIAPEEHFFDLLNRLNTEGIPHALRPVRGWERDGYGWMEDVAFLPCNTLAQVQAFYWRAGALLALIYLARGVDMHRENLIAAGEFPVLIDLEALWHPQEHSGVEDSPIATSVLRTGFLPQTNPQMGATYEWNALGHRLNLNFPAMGWTSVNEDSMTPKRADRPLRGSHHLPVFAGAEYLAKDFLPDILAGFRWVGEQVLADQQKREKFQRWVQVLRQCPRRRILRSSSWYQTALEELTAPASLRKTGMVAAHLARLDQGGVPLEEEEWQALQQFDVPWLKQEGNRQSDQDICLPAQTMEDFLAQEGWIIRAFGFRSNRDD